MKVRRTFCKLAGSAAQWIKIELGCSIPLKIKTVSVDKTVYRRQFETGQMSQEAYLWTNLFDTITMDLELMELIRQKLFEEWEKIFAFVVVADSKFCLWDILTLTRYAL